MEMKGWNCLIPLYQRGPRTIALTGNVDGQFSAAFEYSFTLKKIKFRIMIRHSYSSMPMSPIFGG